MRPRTENDFAAVEDANQFISRRLVVVHLEQFYSRVQVSQRVQAPAD